MGRVIFSRFLTISYNKTMDSKDYYLWEDDRAYISPTVGRDETLQFVDTLRESVGKNNDLISSQTQRLGTDISPSSGGLTGSEGYFQQRYQTLPVQNQVATLKATAQAKALNDLMSNYAAQAKNKYNQAYRNYAKRSGAGTPSPDAGDGDPFKKTPTEDNNDFFGLGPATVDSADYRGENGWFSTNVDNGYGYYRNSRGDILNTNDPKYVRSNSDPNYIGPEKGTGGYYYDVSQVATPVWAELAAPIINGTNLGITYDQWLNQWKANQVAQQKYRDSLMKSGGGGGGW